LEFYKGNNQSDTIKEFDIAKVLFVGTLKPS
jgi:hypothetical protein